MLSDYFLNGLIRHLYIKEIPHFFGVKWLYVALQGLHSVLLPQFTGVLFVFVKKPNEPTEVSSE